MIASRPPSFCIAFDLRPLAGKEEGPSLSRRPCQSGWVERDPEAPSSAAVGPPYRTAHQVPPEQQRTEADRVQADQLTAAGQGLLAISFTVVTVLNTSFLPSRPRADHIPSTRQAPEGASSRALSAPTRGGRRGKPPVAHHLPRRSPSCRPDRTSDSDPPLSPSGSGRGRLASFS